MAISYVGSSNSSTLPAHAAGDLILAFSYRSANATPPTLASGYTSAFTISDASGSLRVGYKIATSGSESGGTWTNSTANLFSIYRGTDQSTPIGGYATWVSGSDDTVDYPAVSPMVDAGGSSWGVSYAAADTNAVSIGLRTGYTSRVTGEGAGVYEHRICDSNSTVTSIGAVSLFAGGPTALLATQLEVLAPRGTAIFWAFP